MQLILYLFFVSLFVVSSAVDITSNLIQSGPITLRNEDYIIEPGVYWSLIDTPSLAFNKNVNNKGDFFVTSLETSKPLSITMANTVTNAGNWSFDSRRSPTSSSYLLPISTFQNTGNMWFQSQSAPPKSSMTVTAYDWSNTGLMVFSLGKRSSRTITLDSSGLFASGVNNDGTICLINEEFEQTSNVGGNGCFDIGENSNIKLTGKTVVFGDSVNGGQMLYMSSNTSSITADGSLLSGPVLSGQLFSGTPITVRGFGNGNLLGRPSSFSSFNYDGNNLIIGTGILGLSQTAFNIGPGYTSSLFQLVSTNYGNPGQPVVNSNAVRYNGPVPDPVRPSKCKVCQRSPFIPGVDQSSSSSSTTSSSLTVARSPSLLPTFSTSSAAISPTSFSSSATASSSLSVSSSSEYSSIVESVEPSSIPPYSSDFYDSWSQANMSSEVFHSEFPSSEFWSMDSSEFPSSEYPYSDSSSMEFSELLSEPSSESLSEPYATEISWSEYSGVALSSEESDASTISSEPWLSWYSSEYPAGSEIPSSMEWYQSSYEWSSGYSSSFELSEYPSSSSSELQKSSQTASSNEYNTGVDQSTEIVSSFESGEYLSESSESIWGSESGDHVSIESSEHPSITSDYYSTLNHSTVESSELPPVTLPEVYSSDIDLSSDWYEPYSSGSINTDEQVSSNHYSSGSPSNISRSSEVTELPSIELSSSEYWNSQSEEPVDYESMWSSQPSESGESSSASDLSSQNIKSGQTSSEYSSNANPSSVYPASEYISSEGFGHDSSEVFWCSQNNGCSLSYKSDDLSVSFSGQYYSHSSTYVSSSVPTEYSSRFKGSDETSTELFLDYYSSDDVRASKSEDYSSSTIWSSEYSEQSFESWDSESSGKLYSEQPVQTLPEYSASGYESSYLESTDSPSMSESIHYESSEFPTTQDSSGYLSVSPSFGISSIVEASSETGSGYYSDQWWSSSSYNEVSSNTTWSESASSSFLAGESTSGSPGQFSSQLPSQATGQQSFSESQSSSFESSERSRGYSSSGYVYSEQSRFQFSNSWDFSGESIPSITITSYYSDALSISLATDTVQNNSNSWPINITESPTASSEHDSYPSAKSPSNLFGESYPSSLFSSKGPWTKSTLSIQSTGGSSTSRVDPSGVSFTSGVLASTKLPSASDGDSWSEITSYADSSELISSVTSLTENLSSAELSTYGEQSLSVIQSSSVVILTSRVYSKDYKSGEPFASSSATYDSVSQYYSSNDGGSSTETTSSESNSFNEVSYSFNNSVTETQPLSERSSYTSAPDFTNYASNDEHSSFDEIHSSECLSNDAENGSYAQSTGAYSSGQFVSGSGVVSNYYWTSESFSITSTTSGSGVSSVTSSNKEYSTRTPYQLSDSASSEIYDSSGLSTSMGSLVSTVSSPSEHDFNSILESSSEASGRDHHTSFNEGESSTFQLSTEFQSSRNSQSTSASSAPTSSSMSSRQSASFASESGTPDFSEGLSNYNTSNEPWNTDSFDSGTNSYIEASTSIGSASEMSGWDVRSSTPVGSTSAAASFVDWHTAFTSVTLVSGQPTSSDPCPDCTLYTSTFLYTLAGGRMVTRMDEILITTRSDGEWYTATNSIQHCSDCTEYTTTVVTALPDGPVTTATVEVLVTTDAFGEFTTMSDIISEVESGVDALSSPETSDDTSSDSDQLSVIPTVTPDTLSSLSTSDVMFGTSRAAGQSSYAASLSTGASHHVSLSATSVTGQLSTSASVSDYSYNSNISENNSLSSKVESTTTEFQESSEVLTSVTSEYPTSSNPCPDCTLYTSSFLYTMAKGRIITRMDVVLVSTDSNGEWFTTSSSLEYCPDCTDYTTTIVTALPDGSIATQTAEVLVTTDEFGEFTTVTDIISEVDSSSSTDAASHAISNDSKQLSATKPITSDTLTSLTTSDIGFRWSSVAATVLSMSASDVDTIPPITATKSMVVSSNVLSTSAPSSLSGAVNVTSTGLGPESLSPVLPNTSESSFLSHPTGTLKSSIAGISSGAASKSPSSSVPVAVSSLSYFSSLSLPSPIKSGGVNLINTSTSTMGSGSTSTPSESRSNTETAVSVLSTSSNLSGVTKASATLTSATDKLSINGSGSTEGVSGTATTDTSIVLKSGSTSVAADFTINPPTSRSGYLDATGSILSTGNGFLFTSGSKVTASNSSNSSNTPSTAGGYDTSRSTDTSAGSPTTSKYAETIVISNSLAPAETTYNNKSGLDGSSPSGSGSSNGSSNNGGSDIDDSRNAGNSSGSDNGVSGTSNTSETNTSGADNGGSDSSGSNSGNSVSKSDAHIVQGAATASSSAATFSSKLDQDSPNLVNAITNTTVSSNGSGDTPKLSSSTDAIQTSSTQANLGSDTSAMSASALTSDTISTSSGSPTNSAQSFESSPTLEGSAANHKLSSLSMGLVSVLSILVL